MSSRLPLRRIRHSLQLPAVKAIAVIASLLPRNVIWHFSRFFGSLAASLPLSSNTIINCNRQNVMKPSGFDVSSRDIYTFLLAGLFDFLHLSSKNDDEFTEVVKVSGVHNLEKAASEGKGVLVITGHYSAWELIPRAITLLGYRTGVVARKLSEKKTSDFLGYLRRKPGVVTIDRGEGAMELLRELRKNTAVGILIDQDTITVESDFIDYFNLPARTPTSPARIALKLGIPVLTMHIKRESDGKYILRIDKPIDLSLYQRKDGILDLTQELTWQIENWVREDPRQWIWLHKRWNRRPD